MAYQSFEDLEVWQRGCRLTVDIFKVFTNCKNFSFKDQIQRAALSIPSNIAEGSERGSSKYFGHFLNIAKGSCGELRTQLGTSHKASFRRLDHRVERTIRHAGRFAPFHPLTRLVEVGTLHLKLNP
jgi:four helix bundle protein